MDYIIALLPYFALGILSAFIARFSGIAMSFLVVPTLLYWGATPVEVISFMLTFTLYNTFTLETQDVRLDFKDLTFFPGWKLLIPLLVPFGLSLVSPHLSIGLFIFFFILELGAALYKRIPKGERPTLKQIYISSILSILGTIVGVLNYHYIPEQWFFLFVGIAMLGLTWFAYYAGKKRSAMRESWTAIWPSFSILLGALGLEISSYIHGVKRNFSSPFERMVPMFTVIGAFAGTMVLFVLENQFSLASLIAAVGCAFGVRLSGTYQFSKNGKFSWLIIGLTVLIVLCLYLVSPTPVGLENGSQLLQAPITQ